MVDQNANKKVFGFGNPKNDAISMFREFCDHIPISYPNALCLGNFFQSYLNVGFRIDYFECSYMSSLFWMFANIISSNGYLACCCRRPFTRSQEVHAVDCLRPKNAFLTIESLTKSSNKASFAASTDESTFSWPLLPIEQSIYISGWLTLRSFLWDQFLSWCTACWFFLAILNDTILCLLYFCRLTSQLVSYWLGGWKNF